MERSIAKIRVSILDLIEGGESDVMVGYSSRFICGATFRLTFAGTGLHCRRDRIYGGLMDCLEAKVGDLGYYWP